MVQLRRVTSTLFMHIDFLGIEAFLAIAEHGSFQDAAARINLSQAAISHRLRKLEELLGARLVQRTTREVMLTEAGRAFLPRARHAVRELAFSCESVRNDRHDAGAWIAIASTATIAATLLPRVLRAFGMQYPDVHVRIFDSSIHEIAELVESRVAAFGVVVQQPVRGELLQEKIAEDPFVLVCRRDHRLRRRRRVSWNELAGEPLIRIRLPFDNAITIDDAIGTVRDTLRWHYESQRHAVALRMVKEGLGITIAPKSHVPSYDELVSVPVVDPAISRTLSLVSRRKERLSAIEDVLRETFVDHIRRHVGADQR